MSGLRISKVSQMKSTQRFRSQRLRQEIDMPEDDSLIRILVLDHERETLERLENALWIWPHKVANAKSVDEALKMCRHLMPTALIVAVDFADDHNGSTITTLRKHLPQVPIIALGLSSDNITMDNALDWGADAFLPREELHRSTLHDLLQRIQQTSESANTSDFPLIPEMPMPFRESKIIGALICDISGTIIDANDCIARWLMYSNADALLGKCVWRDILNSQVDWSAWKTIASDMTAVLYQSISVTAKNNQLLWMKVEICALPNSPSHLQAVFVDQTELGLLTGRTRDT